MKRKDALPATSPDIAEQQRKGAKFLDRAVGNIEDALRALTEDGYFAEEIGEHGSALAGIAKRLRYYADHGNK